MKKRLFVEIPCSVETCNGIIYLNDLSNRWGASVDNDGRVKIAVSASGRITIEPDGVTVSSNIGHNIVRSEQYVSISTNNLLVSVSSDKIIVGRS